MLYKLTCSTLGINHVTFIVKLIKLVAVFSTGNTIALVHDFFLIAIRYTHSELASGYRVIGVVTDVSEPPRS